MALRLIIAIIVVVVVVVVFFFGVACVELVDFLWRGVRLFHDLRRRQELGRGRRGERRAEWLRLVFVAPACVDVLECHAFAVGERMCAGPPVGGQNDASKLLSLLRR